AAAPSGVDHVRETSSQWPTRLPTARPPPRPSRPPLHGSWFYRNRLSSAFPCCMSGCGRQSDKSDDHERRIAVLRFRAPSILIAASSRRQSQVIESDHSPVSSVRRSPREAAWEGLGLWQEVQVLTVSRVARRAAALVA